MPQSIRKQIKTCALFVPVISHAAHDRREGYFRLEWKLAVDRSHLMDAEMAFLLPVVIDDTPDDDERVPERFREVQWTRLPGGVTPAAFVERVSRLLVHHDEYSSAPADHPPLIAPHHVTVVAGESAARRSRLSRWSLLVMALMSAALVSWFTLDKLWLSRRGAQVSAATAGQGTVSEASIAVLPFADMSEKKDQGYFADGMAEEILDFLAKVPRLTVISRTSSFQFKGRDVDVKTIGSTLGAHYLVEGSVRKSDSRVRITAQLIDTGNGTHRWSETYDRDVGDVFGVQDEIAGSIVRALELAVVGSGENSTRGKPKNPAAYDLYLQGRQAFDRYDKEGFEQAADLYQQALDLDPQLTPAVVALADVQSFLAQWGYVAPQIGYERARRTAEDGVKLDPRLSEPHRILSIVHLQYDWDWAAARSEIDRAVELDPHNSVAHQVRGLVSLSLGRLDDATSEMNAALRLDPLSPNLLFTLGWVRFWSGHLPEAESAFRKALQISPTYESAHYYLGHVLLARGDLKDALAQMQQELDGESKLAGIASVEFAMGRRKESDAALAQLTTRAADDWASGIASTRAIRSEPDAAFQWLERAYVQKDVDLYLIKRNPLLRNIARDPRYAAFLRRMKLPD